jgi:hypothetical protein
MALTGNSPSGDSFPFRVDRFYITQQDTIKSKWGQSQEQVTGTGRKIIGFNAEKVKIPCQKVASKMMVEA